MVTQEELYERISQLEDEKYALQDEVEHLKECLERLNQDIEDNYRPIPISEQVGISDKDFI